MCFLFSYYGFCFFEPDSYFNLKGCRLPNPAKIYALIPTPQAEILGMALGSSMRTGEEHLEIYLALADALRRQVHTTKSKNISYG